MTAELDAGDRPVQFDLTDLGNARRFARDRTGDVRYTATMRRRARKAGVAVRRLAALRRAPALQGQSGGAPVLELGH